MAEIKGLQKLYLLKGDNEDSNIFINTTHLPQHQYDGIRFLYRQFHKGKAGVILNDPSGYGKRVQSVLFVTAMYPVMTLPTLILCTDGLETIWTELFRQWTNLGSDVFLQKGNEYTRSMCVIGSISQLYVLCRREWGIIVVDDNNVSRETLRAGISAKYRIWLTSFDMEKHLQTFSLIYKWLYPKEKFNVEDFQADKKPTALLSNSARLDAFMEDIVIRRRHVSLPIGKLCQTLAPQKVTRKNKDATGKKIKRSRPLPASDYDSSAESLSLSQGTLSHSQGDSEQNLSAEVDKNGEVKDGRESIEDFVVHIEHKRESKVDKDDISDELLKDVTSNHIDEVANEPKMKSGDNATQETDKMDTEFNPGNDKVPKSESDSPNDILYLLNNDNVDSQSIIIKYDSETQNDEINNDIPAKKSKITNDITISEDLFSTDVALSDSKNEKVNNIAKTKQKNSEDLCSEELTNRVSNEIKTEGVYCKINELVNDNCVSGNKTDPQLSGIGLKINQLEELDMK